MTGTAPELGPVSGSSLVPWRIVASCEVRRLLRDRRAILFAVVLPMLLYPLFLWGTGKLQKVSERQLERTEVRAAADLRALEPQLRGEVLDALSDAEGRFEVEEQELAELASLGVEERRLEARARLEQQDDLSLLVLGVEADDGPPRLFLFERSSDEAGAEAASRARRRLADLRERGLVARLQLEIGEDPAHRLRTSARDWVRPEDEAGASLGRFLPLIAVIVLLSAGAFAALDAFAAEREVGTLETLLVQPVPSLEIARGKFAAVLGTGVLAWFGNGASLIVCAMFGWLDPTGTSGPVRFDPTVVGRVALGTMVFLPTSVLLAAALCWFSSRARSFREGQQVLLPLTLVSLALAAPSASATLELDVLWAVVPLSGPSLALRDALVGRLDLTLALLAFAASLVPAWLVLARLGDTLDAERLLQGDAPRTERARRGVPVRRAFVFGSMAALGVYVVGGWLQARSLPLGLALTLWVLALGIALELARRNAGDTGTSLRDELALRPAAAHWSLAALLAAPALAYLARRIVELQSGLLPMVESDAAAMDAVFGDLLALQPWLVFFLLAVSPGVCEELLFRGSVLSGLLRDKSLVFALGFQALFFALAHASVHRLAVTFLLGLVLAGVRMRAGSILPCILLHAAYNGATVATALDPRLEPYSASPWTLLLLLPLTASVALTRRR